MQWNSRLMWSGEMPLDYPGLNPVAFSRTEVRSGNDFADAVNPARTWSLVGAVGPSHDEWLGHWGWFQVLNSHDPATDQARLTLPHFPGMWPSSGRLLVGMWLQHFYTMTFNPLISTRGGVSPLFYLSSYTTGDPRHQLYNASGALILDYYEDSPFSGSTGWTWLGQLIDLDQGTSQILTVDFATGQAWASPVRQAAGTPNLQSTANLDVFSLQTAGYWSGGSFDEVLIAHPDASFDTGGFLDALGRGTWARGQNFDAWGRLEVTDSEVRALSTHTLETGAEQVSWTLRPTIQGAPAGATPHWSDDDGATWHTGPELPEPFDGLLRWFIPLPTGTTFSGLTLTEPTSPPPTLDPLPDLTLRQGETGRVPLRFTITGEATWQIDAPPLVTVTRDGEELVVEAGFRTGDAYVTVTLADELGREASQSFLATVELRTAPPPPATVYSGSPIVLWGEDEPDAVLIDPVRAVVLKEVNGEHSFTFTIPANHPRAGVLHPERRVDVAGEPYRVRRLTTRRRGRALELDVYCEARFYDLATAGQIDGREWVQVTAGEVMADAVRGTGWTVDVAEIATLRTYETEDTNPLALLRVVQEQHGGDLVFDNHAQTVSLYTSAGRDNGVSFFYGHGLTEAKRVVDTTSLVTRIYARNADGETIAPVNGGVPYLEDYSYTSELKTAVYDFKAGTSPFTMLAMTQATLARRCRPDYSYEVQVDDLSAASGQEADRFDVGDRVTVIDHELNLLETQRIVRLEYDLVRPWASQLTLSGKLRETGSSDTQDAGVFTTGSTISTFDLVPYNLLLNGRFDNGLQHWAHFGAEVIDAGQGTSDFAVRFQGAGEHWIEQTVQADNRSAFALSLDVESDGPSGWVPNLICEATVFYEDGTSDTIELDLE